MKIFLFVMYIIAIGDAYYATFHAEPKTPPQHQTMQITIIDETIVTVR